MNRLLLVVLFSTLFVNTPTVVKAETMLRVIFNNGTIGTGMSCNAAEDALIDSIFNFTFRRNLRTASPPANNDRKINFLDNTHTQNNLHREVMTKAECGEKCRGTAYGTCHVSDCNDRWGFRKLYYGLGTASNSTLCTTTSAAVNAELDYLVTQNLVSSTCQALLTAPRTVECFEDTFYGMIQYFNLYDANTDRPIKNAMDGGYHLCSGKLITFLIIANDCVETVNITLTGTNGFRHEKIDNSLPYTLFGRNGTSLTNFNGKILPDGNYTIAATPDGYDVKRRSRKFTVGPC